MAIATYKRIRLIDAITFSNDKNRVGNIYFADEDNQLIRANDHKFNLADLPNTKFFEKRLEG